VAFGVAIARDGRKTLRGLLRFRAGRAIELLLFVAAPSATVAAMLHGAKAIASVQPIVGATTNSDVAHHRGAQGRPRLNVIKLEKSRASQRRPSADTNEHRPYPQIDLSLTDAGM